MMKDPIERAQHYRAQSEKLRTMAESEYDDKSRRDLLVLANQYDALSKEMLERAILCHRAIVRST